MTKATSNVGIYTSHPVLHFIPDGKIFLHIRRFHHRNVAFITVTSEESVTNFYESLKGEEATQRADG